MDLQQRIIRGPDGKSVSPMRNREAWKVVRGPRIGSSDGPPILGQSEYVGPWEVWDRIVLGDWGDAKGADIRRGVKQEAIARQKFVELTGLEVSPLPMVHHPEHELLVTDVDGLIQRPEEWPAEIRDSELWSAICDQEGPGYLELKVPRIPRFYEYKEEGLPRHHIIQGQHHAEVTGLRWGFHAFYTPEYDDLVAFPVLRDPEWCEWSVAALLRWHDAHVVARVRPDRPMPPPPRWPDPVPGEAKMRDDSEWMEWAELTVLRYYELVEAQEAYEQTEAELRELLGDDEQHVAGGGVTVKRRSTSPRTLTDWKAFRAAVKLAQKEGDTETLLSLDPDDDRFKYQSNTSEKVEVKVRGPNPMEIMKEVA